MKNEIYIIQNGIDADYEVTIYYNSKCVFILDAEACIEQDGWYCFYQEGGHVYCGKIRIDEVDKFVRLKERDEDIWSNI